MRIKKPLAISLIFIIILSFVLAIFQKIGWMPVEFGFFIGKEVAVLANAGNSILFRFHSLN